MKAQEFEYVCMACIKRLRELAPKDTGNLAYNAIQYEWVNESTFKIYVNETIAPYIMYTEYPWVSEKWHGKKNPNEGWFETAARIIAELVANLTKGELKR